MKKDDECDHITDVKDEKELEFLAEKQRVHDSNKARDAQRAMAWFALFGMLLYPFAVVLSSFLGLQGAAEVLGSMAGTYFVSVAAIVAAFYGKEHFDSRFSRRPENPEDQNMG